METQSRRRQQAHEELDAFSQSEQLEMDAAIEKEKRRQEKKLQRKMEIEESTSYQLIKWISTLMDKYFLDPLIGLLPVVGDMLTSTVVLPFIYVSLCKIRSIPLTLAVISNTLIDVMLGIIPFWIGNICDFFHRSNLKNFRLITGFVDDNREIIDEVNRRAVWTGVVIVILCIMIITLISLVASLF